MTNPTTDTFCTGKRPFHSYKEAARAAAKTSQGHDVRCHPYKCTDCGMYHYGQSDRRLGKRVKQPRQHQLELNLED